MELSEVVVAIAEDVQKYTEEKSKAIDKAVRQRTGEALTDIIEHSPVRKRVPKKTGVVMVHGAAKENYQPGAYKKGWIKYTSTKREGRTQGYVRNKTNYQLVHLLELGHDLKRNGRKIGYVDPIKHVDSAEDTARKKLADDINSILSEE